jgi:hypothetical protein
VEPNDWVRREIEAALTRQIPLFPVALDDATIPAREVLPPSMGAFGRRNVARLRASSWDEDIARLFNDIDKLAITKTGANLTVLVEGRTPLARRRGRASPLIQPGSRVRIGLWAGTFGHELTGLPFEIAAATGQTGTVLRIDGRIAWVRWDAQQWAKRFLGFFRGSTVHLDSFEASINADYLEPLV